MVHNYLQSLSERVAEFDYERLPDARSAMGRFKSMVGDFAWFYPGRHGVIEVKETQHDYRLAKDKLPQLARLKKRVLAGGTCLILVYHSTANVWRCLDAAKLPLIERGSWDLREMPTFSKVSDIEIVKDK
ncbi:hypothetical protein [Oligella urethralis]|nr:hypothetical protein [Oligella urethralis]